MYFLCDRKYQRTRHTGKIFAQWPENKRPSIGFLTWLKLLPLALCVNKFSHTRLLAIFNGAVSPLAGD